MPGSIDRIEVALQSLLERAADGNLLRRTREQIEDKPQLPLIVREQVLPCHLQCFPCVLRCNEGIPITIAADPGSEGKQYRHVGQVQADAILRLEGRTDFCIKARQGGIDGRIVVVEAHLHLVAHRGPAGPDLVRLPQRGDLSGKAFLEELQLLVRERDAVELLEQICDAAPLEHHHPPRYFGRVCGEHRNNGNAA